MQLTYICKPFDALIVYYKKQHSQCQNQKTLLVTLQIAILLQ